MGGLFCYQERVEKMYYKHGLFMSNHPIVMITVSCIIILCCCYPLLNLPLPGNGPVEFVAPISLHPSNDPLSSDEDVVKSSNKPPPPWFKQSQHEGYIQQFIIKSVVHPWDKTNMKTDDAFRAPLARLFTLLEEINNFKTTIGDKEYSIAKDCYHVSEATNARRPIKQLLPEYNCLVVSPVSFWGKDKQKFIMDANIMHTVHKYQGKTIETSPSLKELLFGTPSRASGATTYPVRNRQRVLTYAVTLIIKNHHIQLLKDLRSKLSTIYPTNEPVSNCTTCEEVTTHIYYKSQITAMEIIPLLSTSFLMGCYIYFSVRKINLVKSKLGMAFSAVITIMASLMMSVGMCSLFGLTPTLNGGEIFPYLVIVIGLENILVITKSVVATPLHLDVDKRIALGISREGCSITKNIVLELVLIGFGYFTFVPEIQEFCAFAVVGVMVDFFLQMFFFLTILSVDIRRLDITEEMYAQEEDEIDKASLMPDWVPKPNQKKSMLSNLRSKNKRSLQDRSHTLETGGARVTILKIPKRLKVLFFWADTRMVQRGIMVFMVIWYGLIMYGNPIGKWPSRAIEHTGKAYQKFDSIANSDNSQQEAPRVTIDTNGDLVWSESDLFMHQRLSYKHWPALFGYYNVTLVQRFISILPSIPISMVISPQEAAKYRYYGTKPDNSLVTEPPHEEVVGHQINSPYQQYQMTGLDYYLTLFVGAVSGMFMVFLLTVMYKCICTRNYASWRSRGRQSKSRYTAAVSESLPLVLNGHPQAVECMASEESILVSSDLSGEIRVWDSQSGDCTTVIHRITTPVPERYPLEGALDAKPSPLGYQVQDKLYDTPHINHDTLSASPKEDIYYQKSPNDVRPKGHRRTTSADVRVTNDRFAYNPSFNLASLIRTDFDAINKTKAEKRDSGSSEHMSSSSTNGYDFKGFLDEHFKDQMFLFSDDIEPCFHSHRSSSRSPNATSPSITRSSTYDQSLSSPKPTEEERNVPSGWGSWESGMGATSWNSVPGTPIEMENGPAIWSLVVWKKLVIAGCENGRVEIWDGESGLLKCCHDVGKAGVSGMVVEDSRLVVARINGSLDFFNMEVTNFKLHPLQYRGSRSSNMESDFVHSDILTLQLVYTIKSAHQQPITVFKIAFGRVVTGSFDHTMKLFTVQDARCLFTMYGHTAPITALSMDTVSPTGCASGSSDGAVKLWDLPTGECLHKLDEHEGEIVTLECTIDLVVSVATDDKVCVWARRTGTLLHVCNLEIQCATAMCLLGNCWCVTPGNSCLQLWDIRNGELIKTVKLLDDSQIPTNRISQIVPVGNLSVAVDFGYEMRIIRFPSVLEKVD